MFLVLSEKTYNYSGNTSLSLEDDTYTLQEAEAIKDELESRNATKKDDDNITYHILPFKKD